MTGATQPTMRGAVVDEKPVGYGKSEVVIFGATLEIVLAAGLAWVNQWRGYEPRTHEAMQRPDGSWTLRGDRWTRL